VPNDSLLHASSPACNFSLTFLAVLARGHVALSGITTPFALISRNTTGSAVLVFTADGGFFFFFPLPPQSESGFSGGGDYPCDDRSRWVNMVPPPSRPLRLPRQAADISAVKLFFLFLLPRGRRFDEY